MSRISVSFLYLIFLCIQAHGQSSIPLTEQAVKIIREHFPQLSDKDGFKFLRSSTRHNVLHQRFQRTFDGIRVLGEHVVVHHRGQEQFVTGQISLSPIPQTQPGLALNQAKERVVSQVYPQLTHKKEDIKYKHAELVIASHNYPLSSQALTLAWLFEIGTVDDDRRILLDAMDGRLIMNVSRRHLHKHREESTNLQNPTLYHGPQDMTFEGNTTDGYTLLSPDNTLLFQVQTTDSLDYEDDDGLYDVDGHAHRTGALDAYWGTEKTLEYLLNQFQHQGLRNQPDDTLKSYIFPESLMYNNAFWDGEAVYYGTGDQNRYGPFTSIDICAHEILHGVTEFTSGLEYTYESGALNEAFSDIFGKTVEHFYSASNFTWELGDRIGLDTLLLPGERGFRNMRTPNRYGNAQYYRGRFWRYNRFDNGGVHSNSGVLNHWFYLLVEGGTGTNEGNETYSVNGLGFETAIDLCYDVLTNYLTPTSQYQDARDATLLATILTFGKCSPEYQSVTNAWHAVGLYSPEVENDLALIGTEGLLSFCDGQDIRPTLEILNPGCAETILEGTQIIIEYGPQNGSSVSDTVMLPADLPPGEIWKYRVVKPIPSTTTGYQRIIAKMDVEGDASEDNNELAFLIEVKEQADFDIDITPIFDNRPDCERENEVSLLVLGEYHGCTPILYTDTVYMTARLNGQLIRRQLNPFRTVYSGAFVIFQDVQFDNLQKGNNRIELRFDYPQDPNPDNNWQVVDLFVIDNISSTHREDFESEATIDSSKVTISKGKFTNHSVQEEEGSNSFVICGSSMYNMDSTLRIDTNVNNVSLLLLSEFDYQSNITMCFDSRDFIDPVLEFKVKRTRGDFDHQRHGWNPDLAALMSVNYDGFVEYLVDMPWDEFEVYNYDLTDMDTIQSITLRNFTLTGRIDHLTGEIDPGSDRIIYDYITIRDRVVGNQITQHPGAMRLSGNPSGIARLLFDQPEGTIEIYNLKGRSVTKEKVVSSEMSIGGTLTPGIYTIVHRNDDVLNVVKWIKSE